MGCAFRRCFKDKKTGKTKKIRTYSIKYLDVNGCWHTEPTETTSKTVALRILAERELQVRTASPAPQRDVPAPTPVVEEHTLEEIRGLYLSSIGLRLQASTCRMYAERLCYTLRELAIRHPSGLSTQLIDRYVRDRMAAGSAPRTVNMQATILQRMLKWAVGEGLARSNPLERWKPVRDPGTLYRRALTAEEVHRLLEASPGWQKILWAVMAATGIRKGEAVNLLISDFDPIRGVVRLRREITKTNRDRACPLPAGLADLLARHLEQERESRPQRQKEYLDRITVELRTLKCSKSIDGRRARTLSEMEKAASAGIGHQYLFANGKGLPLRRNLDREFRATLKRAGIEREGLCIHSLRYTANSTLLAAGIPEAVIRARMGHVTSKMTSRYFDPLADNGIGTDAIARLLGVPDVAPESPTEHGAGEPSRVLSLEEDRPFRPTMSMLAAMAERYSNIGIGKILLVSEKAVRDMLKRAGIKRTEPATTVLDDWQVALIRAELKAELGRGRDGKRAAGDASTA